MLVAVAIGVTVPAPVRHLHSPRKTVRAAHRRNSAGHELLVLIFSVFRPLVLAHPLSPATAR